MKINPFRRPRGTHDLLGETLDLVQLLEQVAVDVAVGSGYREIRTPLFEETRLFKRSLGDSSDVVEKEMFSVVRRGENVDEKLKEGFTFRPEGTASAARAYIQGGFHANNPIQKWFYVGPMFRYERPQKGRDRQFDQFGVEAFGTCAPSLDVEIINIAIRFFKELGFGDEIEVRINTMGDIEDREVYSELLRNHFSVQVDKKQRCGDCLARFERNIFRLLDCKSLECVELNKGVPKLISSLGSESAEHHQALIKLLKELKINFVEDSSIVRGLDYYTRTVFEIHYPPLGARSALCGGGRYDGLVEEMGGKPTPGIGFSVGFSPTLLAMSEIGLPENSRLDEFKQLQNPDVYIVAVSPEQMAFAFQLCEELRDSGFKTVVDHRGKSLKAQLKEANRMKARWAIIIGEEEMSQRVFLVKDMSQKQEFKLKAKEVFDFLREQ